MGDDARAREQRDDEERRQAQIEWHTFKVKVAYGVLVVGVLVTGILIARCASRGGGGDTTVRTGEPPPKRERMEGKSVATVVAEAKPSVELPSTPLYAKAIIGKSQRDLDRSFGVGTDVNDGRRYTVAGVPVTVGFEKKKAIWYYARPDGYMNTDEISGAVLEWMAADVDDDAFAVDLDGDVPKVWAAKAWARSPGGKAEAEAIARLTNQTDVIGKLAEAFDEYGIVGMASEQDGELVIGANGCDHQVLEDLRDGLKQKHLNPKIGFTGMRCAGDHGAWLELK